ncbi:archaea-specific SMC-related protein, partial [Haloferax profundi]|uniref:archaea-specific SMC-related protein n=1 Tax=Haloferax profundi TaxID=1544718 RepID=UPI000A614BBE
MSTSEALQRATVRIQNIGGIDSREVTLSPGVTVLTGRNATNRTSFLRALMAACGSDAASIKGDADEGSVELELNGRTFTRVLTRENGRVSARGTPYLQDTLTADLFAFLLASNEARDAVVANRNLHDVIMAPVDTDEINAEIERLQSERKEIKRELKNLSSLEAEKQSLEAKRSELEAEIADLEEKREDVSARIDDEDRTVEAQRENQDELDRVLGELQDARSNLETVRFRLQSERESVESLRQERSELEDELNSFEEADIDRESVSARTDQIRTQIEHLNTTISDLQTVIQYTEDVLDGKTGLVEESLTTDTGDGAPTDQLAASDTIICWTCGTEVDSEQIEQTTNRLRATRDDKREHRAELRRELDELESDLQDAEESKTRRQNIQRKLS